MLITRTFWVNQIPGIDESQLPSSSSRARLLPPSRVPSIVLLSSALQSTVLGYGAVAVRLTRMVLITVMLLSLPPFIILHRRLRAFCCRPFVLLSLRSVHPSRSSFIRQRFGRSVHPYSGPEPIRCIPPSLSLSFSFTQRLF